MRHLSFLIFFALTFSICLGQSPHGAKFDRDCQQCHSLESWKVVSSEMKFNHIETGFDLIGQHKTVQCKTCHISLKFSEQKNKKNCVDCHLDIHENTVGKNCVRCHDPHTWIIENILDLHRFGRFPLLGNHVKANCNQCHKSSSKLRFEPMGINCFDCHSNNYYATKNPDHAKANFSTDCRQCHNLTSLVWSASSIVHDFFPLTGSHNIANCFSCHRQDTYKGLNQSCYTCHQKNYETVTAPNHVTLNFPKDCKQCHNTNGGWKPALFSNHDSFYPLLGAHNLIRVDCNKCHATGYSSPARQCVNCHQKNYDDTVNPNHRGAGFSTECLTCHSQSAWKPATFDHDIKSFPIYSGSHKGKWNLCSECHINQTNYKNFECINCHEHNKNDMDSKHNGINGYTYQSRTCFACHPQGSKEGVINHSLTNFPLLGAHLNVPCNQCHQNGYAGTPTQCVSCHQSKFTTAPNHVAQSYPQDCKQCHSSIDWKQINFNHSTTSFPLLGIHTTVKCNSCHVTKLTGTSKLCYSCHQTNFTSAPNHVSQGYPQTCEQCHTPTAWKPSSFNHATTRFPLLGAHVTVNCNSCHKTGFAGTSTLCYSCHQTNFISAPNHVSQGYPQTCEQCHTSTAWKPSSFNHATTKFPLLGAHTTVSCNLCHKTGFAGTSTLCYSCHQTNYQSTTNPNHVSLNIPTSCEQCHTTNPGWKPATFPIHNNYYPLLGAHTTVNCSSCHKTGFTGTPTLCYSCHSANYNGTRNPNHATAKFPTNCETCHSQNAWTPSTFNHDGQYFPIYSGEHNGKWTLCSDCHTNQSNFLIFECINCHEHNKTDTDKDHQGVRNYAYLSSACYNCHPTGGTN